MRRTGNVIITVEVGGVEVDVALEYQITTDNNYGADADGNRGVCMTECEVVDKYIDSMPDPPITTEQGQEAMDLAENKFLDDWGHYTS